MVPLRGRLNLLPDFYLPDVAVTTELVRELPEGFGRWLVVGSFCARFALVRRDST